MRRTAKYIKALACAKQIGFASASRVAHETLYDTLDGAGWWWDASAGANAPHCK